MKRASILVALLVALTPLATAATQVADAWFYWDGQQSIDGNTVSVNLAENQEIVRVTVDDNESTAVGLDGCQDLNRYSYCFEETSEDNKPDIGPDGEVQPGVRLVILREELSEDDTNISIDFSPSADVTVDKPNQTRYGREHDITFNFSNTGDAPLFGFTGRVTPEGVNHSRNQDELLLYDDTTYEVNAVLETNESVPMRLSYTPTSTDPSFRIIYEYRFDNKSYRTTENVTVDLPDAYNYTASIPGTVALYQAHDINVTAANQLNDQDITVDTIVEKNRNQYLGDDNTEYIDRDTRRWTETIEPNESETASTVFFPRYTGDTDITVSSNISYLSYTDNHSTTTTITTPEPDVTLNTDSQATPPGSNAAVTVTLDNNEAEYYLEDIDARITTRYGAQVYQLGNASPAATLTEQVNYSVPYGAPTETVDADIDVRYRTPTNELFKAQDTTQFDVTNASHAARITHDATPETPGVNESVTITATAENTGANPLDGRAEDTLEPYGPSTTTSLSLEPGSTEELYDYTIDYNGTPVTTTTEINATNHTQQTTTTITGETPANNDDNQTTNTTNASDAPATNTSDPLTGSNTTDDADDDYTTPDGQQPGPTNTTTNESPNTSQTNESQGDTPLPGGDTPPPRDDIAPSKGATTNTTNTTKTTSWAETIGGYLEATVTWIQSSIPGAEPPNTTKEVANETGRTVQPGR